MWRSIEGVVDSVKGYVRLGVAWSTVRFTVGFVLGSVQCGAGFWVWCSSIVMLFGLGLSGIFLRSVRNGSVWFVVYFGIC